MDYDTLTFTPDGGYHHLDHGFDFYAAQGAANVGDPDRAVLIAWIGLPDNHYPTEEEDWEGSMSLPRELRVRGGKLIQTPLPEITQLRGASFSWEKGTINTLGRACELEVTAAGGDNEELVLFCGQDGSGGLHIAYDAERKVCTVDRIGMHKRFNEKVGEVLEMPLESPLRKMQIFIDHSSVEIFVNDGEETFTTHLYPEADELFGRASGGLAVNGWELKPSVKDDFVI